jgi:hypothetical protein
MATSRKSNALVEVTKNINKKGRLKGKNKKETKALIGMCPHHRLNKHGKVRPTIIPSKDNTRICTMCAARFDAKFYTNEDVENVLGEMDRLNQQAKFMATAINAGDKTVDFFATTGVILKQYKKLYKRLRNVAQKQGSIRNKQKNKGNGYSNSASYGSWQRK